MNVGEGALRHGEEGKGREGDEETVHGAPIMLRQDGSSNAERVQIRIRFRAQNSNPNPNPSPRCGTIPSMHRLAEILLFLAITGSASAATSAFSDVPADHPAAGAIEDLSIRGILQGNPDGTFRPDEPVNRAAALKIIVKPLTMEADVTALTQSSYTDVSNAAWYFPFVERAYQTLHIIDGPPITTEFHPDRTVTKAEFLKMLLLANNVDPKDFDDLRSSLTSDVANANEWFYPYMRFAMSAGLIEPTDNGLLEPGKELSRAETAMIFSAFFTYRENRMVQKLVERTEAALLSAINSFLREGSFEEAVFASARAVLLSRSALRLEPASTLLQGLVKTAEGFSSLVQSRASLQQEQWAQAETQAKDAWNSAEEARNLDVSLSSIASELQRLSHTLAASARESRQWEPGWWHSE